MKRGVLFLIVAGLAAGVAVVLWPGGPFRPMPSPDDELSLLEAEIEKSLKNPKPGELDLEAEVQMLQYAGRLAGDDAIADEQKAPPPVVAKVVALPEAPPVERNYDLRAVETKFLETLQIVNLDDRRRGLQEIASFLAQHDTETASRFMQAILNTRDRLTDSDANAFATTFVDEFSKINPAAAAEWSDTLPERIRYPAHQMLARNWAAKDPQALEAWTAELDDPGLRANAIRMMSHALSVADPGHFAPDWAMRLAANPADGPRLSEVVVQHWGKTDFDAAARWAAGLATADDRESGVLALTRTRAESEPAAAANWARDSLQGGIRSTAIQEAIRTWALKDPAAAANWVDQLGDSAIADATFDTVAISWMRKDQAAAEPWINKAKVAQHRKEYVHTIGRN
jgi:hypothetical protein